MNERRYYLIDCLGRPVRPSGYTTARGAHSAAARRHAELLDQWRANGAIGPCWTIKYCTPEDMQS